MLVSEGRYQYVIRFDVGMHNITLAQQTESEKELFGINSNCPDVQSNIFAKSFNDFAKIHAKVSQISN
jgi:hypothetical protein